MGRHGAKIPWSHREGQVFLIASEGAICWYYDLGDFNLSIVM